MIAIPRCSAMRGYEESITRAGGRAYAVDPAATTPAAVIAGADGLLLAGGYDVDPALYGEAPHPSFIAAEPGRDTFEIELIHRALDADLPILAACRGIQVLNVARGGTLIQDIPSQVGDALEHMLPVPPHAASATAHDVRLSRGSQVATLLHDLLDGAGSCGVNSRHHQSIRDVGQGLVVTGTAPDGIVEAIEHPGHRFVVAVQWHPESYWRTGEFGGLFRGLVEAARHGR